MVGVRNAISMIRNKIVEMSVTEILIIIRFSLKPFLWYF